MSGTERKNQTKLKSIAPQFAVPDVVAAAEYYRDILGFRILGYFGQPTVFSIVARDNVEIQLGKSDPTARPAPNSVQREDGLDAYGSPTSIRDSPNSARRKYHRTATTPRLLLLRNGRRRAFRFRLAFALVTAE